MVVRRGVEGGGHMALGAHGVARGTEPEAMWLVAVRAGHAGTEHAALHERPVLIDLTQDLSIGMIERRVEERRHVGVEERAARRIKVDQRAPARMAAGTRLHFGCWGGGAAPSRNAALWGLHHPAPTGPPRADGPARRASPGRPA